MTGSTATRKRKALGKVAAEGDGRPQVQADPRTGARRGSAARPDLDAQLLIRMARTDVRWLRQHALDREEPMSEIVRRIIGEYIAANGGRK
jgi:hypothetical protein